MSCWGPEHRSSEREHLQNVKRRLLPSAMVAKLLLYMDYSYLQQNNRLAYRFSRRRQLWCPKENSWSGIGGARFNSAFAFRHYGIIYCCIARYAKFSALKKTNICYLLQVLGSRDWGMAWLSDAGLKVFMRLQCSCQPGLQSSEGLTGLEQQLPGRLIHYKVVGRRNPFFTACLTVITPEWMIQETENKKKKIMINAFYDLALEVSSHHSHRFHSLEGSQGGELTLQGRRIRPHQLKWGVTKILWAYFKTTTGAVWSWEI